MSTNRSEIKFIRPCLKINEDKKNLTPEYTFECLKDKKIVQINLDNCALQRMEMLSSNSTLIDVERVGLMPLVELLQTGEVCMTAIGVNEMPDKWVERAMAAYNNFCNIFWPGHSDDPEATYRDYIPDSNSKQVIFQDLNAKSRTVYGLHYIPMLQIQNINLNYSGLTPEKKFETYLYSIINFIDIISAYDLEIAKYAFWDIDANTINRLPANIHNRRKNIKNNFHKNGNSLKKCCTNAFDAAMDLHWLTGANLSEDMGSTINIKGQRLITEHWVGTTDHKLYNITQDIHHIYHEGSTMKALLSTREDELMQFNYWKNVDHIANSILSYRKNKNNIIAQNMTERVDLAIELIEKDLAEYFS